MKVLVFGANGRAGMALVRHAASHGHVVFSPTSSECDFRNGGAVREVVFETMPDCVFNCAAMSSLEGCAADEASCRAVNVRAPQEMAFACMEIGARLVHVSTDYVYDGESEGLKSEDSAIAPVSVYARSKLESEERVLSRCPAAAVARVSWLCGNPERPGFVESVVRKTLAREPIAAIADKTSKPTNVDDLAEALLHIAGSRIKGPVNVCSSGGPVSWHWLAETAVREVARLVPGMELPRIEAQRLDDIPFFRELRPRHTAMDNSLLAESGFVMPSCEATVRAAVKAVFDTCNSAGTRPFSADF